MWINWINPILNKIINLKKSLQKYQNEVLFKVNKNYSSSSTCFHPLIKHNFKLQIILYKNNFNCIIVGFYWQYIKTNKQVSVGWSDLRIPPLWMARKYTYCKAAALFGLIVA